MSPTTARSGSLPVATARSLDDGALVARVRRGDAAAYADLVRRHQGRLYRQARGMGLDADTCEDLVQEAFVTAYERLDDCHDPSRFGVWVYRILRNRCLDHLKDIRRRSVPLEDVVLPADEDPEREANRALLREGIRRGLASLSPRLREAFLMKHHLEMEYKDMAEIHGVGVSAMKMRVQRAREELRRALAERCLDEEV